MKKYILAITMVCVLFMSSSFNVFAGTASRSGMTTGGTEKSISTSASLSVNSIVARAYTSAEETDGVTFSTTVMYYYTDSNNQTVAIVNVGTTSAGASCNGSRGLRATSQHIVNGSYKWGNWSCNLEASV